MTNPIRVFLCDDHTLFRQGVRKLLELEDDMKIVGEANNGVEMLILLRKANPDVVLMDIGMPDMDGITATCEVKRILPHADIIILTIHGDGPHISQAIKAGAKGYLLKDVSIDELLQAIRSVHKGEAIIQPVVASKILKEFVLLDKRKMDESDKLCDRLTEREKQVLRLIALGGTNKEIANKLGIREKTVKNHITRIFQTLHVSNRTQAALYALDKKV